MIHIVSYPVARSKKCRYLQMQPVVCILPALLPHNETSVGSGSQYQSARHVKIHVANTQACHKNCKDSHAQGHKRSDTKCC